MRICRAAKGNDVFYAVIENDTAKRLKNAPYDGIAFNGEAYGLQELKLLAPAEPSKIVCLGMNYADHAEELALKTPQTPLIFLKPNTSVINPLEGIDYPPDSERLDYEAELAIVIGKRCKDVPIENYKDVIFGYTCLNDVTARDLQFSDGQWTRGKGYDTFCPFGPWIETELQAEDVRVQARLNGNVCQDARTTLLIHPLSKIIWFISRVMTLNPGDVIATGTPAGIGPMQRGDTIEIEIEGIGILRNHVNKA